MADLRVTFTTTLLKRAETDPRLAVVVSDSVSSSKLGAFQKAFPSKIYNVGIAEQNLVGFASGLAAVGFIPWACAATCFLSYRSLEQIKNDVVYSYHPVRLVGNTSGVDYGPLGTTHHSLEDLGTLRSLADLTLFIPADHRELAEAMDYFFVSDTPAYLRLYRGDIPRDLSMPGSFQLGQVRVLREGNHCTVFANGRMVHYALQASDLLHSQGLSVGVVNVSCLNPLDEKTIAETAQHAPCVVTLEEHSVKGGLGGAICEVLSEYHPLPVKRIGFPKGHSIPGPPGDLLRHYGLTPEPVAEKIRAFAEPILQGTLFSHKGVHHG